MNVHEHNEKAWNRLARAGHRFSKPASDGEFSRPLETIDPAGWYGGSVRGLDVLCLAAGGGRQGPLYAAAGACVTVVDISFEQLAIDRQVAAAKQLELTTIQASMDSLAMLPEASFDLVIQPVSSCYLAVLAPMFAEIARVTRPGALYVSQHKSPQNLQASLQPAAEGNYRLQRSYYVQEPVQAPGFQSSRLREAGTLEFQHTLEAILGGICHAGFVIEGFVEPFHADKNAPSGTFGHRCQYVAPYLRIKARKSSALRPVPRISQA